MNKWLLGTVLAIAAHFSASYLVPLDEQAQKTFNGLLRWLWPWASGNHGLVGTVTMTSQPLPGLWAALLSASMLILAALAVIGLWVPFSWWRVCAIVGTAAGVILMAMFFGPTKVIPLALDLFLLWAIWTNRITVAGH